MRIGALEAGRVFLAPLSGVADSPFRRVCKGFGAEVVYSEMVSSVGLSKDNWRSRAIMNFHEEERPIGVQLFGREPGFMAGAVPLAEEVRPDFLDLNFSCPASKIVSRGAGAALLREPERIKEITRAVVGAATVPVTAKIRIGWDDAHLVAVEVAKVLEGEGIQAISVHGRTFEQGFSGRASWEAVAEVKRAVGVPVVLSGDVAAPEDAERAFAETGCDALMVGRGSFGRPWVFAAIRDHLSGKAYAGFSHRDVAGVALRHLDLGIEEFGERVAVRRFRKHLLWYTKGMYGVVRLRTEMCKVITRQDVAVLLEELSEHPWQTGSGPVGSWELDGADACSGEGSETGERNG